MKKFIPLTKPKQGDKIAVLSPSAGLPGLFPWVQDRALWRLRNEFGLDPVEYPTTRQMGASYEDRAHDLMAAFADPGIKAVLSSVGGTDEIGLIKHLDAAVFVENPKPYFGYSDNTNLHNFLWCLGIPSFYGCSTMVQLAMAGGVLPLTKRSLRQALLEGGDYEVEVAEEYTDVDLDWADPVNLERQRLFEPNDGLSWDGEGEVSGVLWGGCYDILAPLFVSGHALPSDDDIDGAVFFMETSEELPNPSDVALFVAALGERGWLDRFSAILVGRPKAWSFTNQKDTAAKAAFREAQHEAILRGVRAYNQTIPVVQNLDFGHSDPQVIVPNGGQATVSTSAQKIVFSY